MGRNVPNPAMPFVCPLSPLRLPGVAAMHVSDQVGICGCSNMGRKEYKSSLKAEGERNSEEEHFPLESQLLCTSLSTSEITE